MPAPSACSRFHPAATRRWVARLERFAAGQHTVASFCAAERVSESNFYLWRRRLARPAPPPANPPVVVPIRITPSPATPIELALPSGAVVRFPADTPPQLIAAVLQAWEGRPC